MNIEELKLKRSIEESEQQISFLNVNLDEKRLMVNEFQDRSNAI